MYQVPVWDPLKVAPLFVFIVVIYTFFFHWVHLNVILSIRKVTTACAGARGVDSVTPHMTVYEQSDANPDCSYHSSVASCLLPADHVNRIYFLMLFNIL